MARARGRRATAAVSSAPWAVAALCVTAFLVEVAALPGTASSFRFPKETVALAGLGVVTALALFAGLRQRQLELPRGALALVLAALPIIQLASASWSASPLRALSSAAATGLWTLGILVTATLPAAARRRVITWAVAGAVLSAVVLLSQAAGVEVIAFAGSLVGRFRLTGLTGNPADFAMTAVLLLPLLLVMGRDGRGWRLAAVTALTAATLATLTITAYGALAALLVAWLVHARSRRAWRLAAGAVVVAVAVAAAVGFGGRLEQQISRVRSGDWYALLSARGDGWSAAVQMVEEHPLLGVGAGNYTHRFYPSRLAWLQGHHEVGRRGELATHFEWAHCDPLQAAAELGVPGVLWMAALTWLLIRRRTQTAPLPTLAAAAAMPFLFLHYPTHLAVGTLPLALVLGEILAREGTIVVPVPSPALRLAQGVGAAAVAALAIGWQAERLSVSRWQESLDARLAAVETAPTAAQRTRLATELERELVARAAAHPMVAPLLWRTLGKARLAGGDPAGAAEAFRTAATLFPHAEADLGLGLSLAAEGRRAEALVHLGRVARVNPALAKLITDPDLRQAVIDLTNARREP